MKKRMLNILCLLLSAGRLTCTKTSACEASHIKDLAIYLEILSVPPISAEYSASQSVTVRLHNNSPLVLQIKARDVIHVGNQIEYLQVDKVVCQPDLPMSSSSSDKVEKAQQKCGFDDAEKLPGQLGYRSLKEFQLSPHASIIIKIPRQHISWDHHVEIPIELLLPRSNDSHSAANRRHKQPTSSRSYEIDRLPTLNLPIYEFDLWKAIKGPNLAF